MVSFWHTARAPRIGLGHLARPAGVQRAGSYESVEQVFRRQAAGWLGFYYARYDEPVPGQAFDIRTISDLPAPSGNLSR
jgi:hypothetical protein